MKRNLRKSFLEMTLRVILCLFVLTQPPDVHRGPGLIRGSVLFAEFQWPLKDKTYLTGSFGEFRRNHIHAGIDLSTHNRIGLPVYSCESGHLYRIKIQYEGFGKAVYIKLKDGKILVYAHLDRFSPKIETLVKEVQEREGKFAIDYYPKDRIEIKEDELVAYSGNTGGVSVHLHMELRDPDEDPINPVSFLEREDIKDLCPPFITGLAVCSPFDTSCMAFYPLGKMPKVININGKTGLALAGYDLSYGNRLGIYKIEFFLNGELVFLVKIDKFSYKEFNDNFLVYNKDLWVNKNRVFYNLFRAFGNKLPFYPLDSDGFLNLPQGKYKAVINVYDFFGNKNTVQFDVIAGPGQFQTQKGLRGGIWYSKDKYFKVSINKEDMFYPFDVKIKELKSKQTGELIPMSKVYNVRPKEAIFKKAEISIEMPNDTKKTGLYRMDRWKWKYIDDGIIKDFTQFALFKDITPPSITIRTKYPFFKARIEDNGSGLLYDKIALYIDGKRVIAGYSVSSKLLFYQVPKGSKKIACIAEDKAGNINKKDIRVSP